MTAYKPGDPTTLNRLYGRAVGKPLREAKQRLVDEVLPQITVPAEGAITPARLFGEGAHGRRLHFEIGFGGGEHLAARAAQLPDDVFIGAEPFLNGVAQAVSHIAGQDLTNIRLHHGDALQVLERIPDGMLDMLYLLHPDPWPKARHAKRRMVNDGPVALFARKLRRGGELRFGTDHPLYLRHALMVLRRFIGEFDWLTSGPADWRQRAPDWPETRYEAKARRSGHEIWYFRFRRR
jgi:tRNA (guanine-N7-)-methyltransferase